MTDLQIFKYQTNEIRTIKDEQGEPWFVARDLGAVLGYSESSNVASMTGYIPEEWKGSRRIATPGGEQSLICLSEQGLYLFLARSNKPAALPFQKWIAGEVLPSIRRYGMYATSQALEKMIADPDSFITILQELKKERDERLALADENSLMKPKAEFYDAVTGSRTAIDIGRVAKVLNFRGIGRNYLFKFLRDTKILMPDNTPYQEYIDRQYFRTIEQKWKTPEGETRIHIKTVVYQRGVDYIRKKLLEAGYEPMEEVA